MEIYPADCSFYLIETYIIKPFETSTGNLSDSVIGNEEVLFPAHEKMFSLRKVSIREISLLCLLRKRSPGLKPGPVLHISFLAGAPRLMLCLERMLRANYLPLKKSGQGWMFFCQT